MAGQKLFLTGSLARSG